MDINTLKNELSYYFEDYTIECLDNGKNKLKADGNRYSTYNVQSTAMVKFFSLVPGLRNGSILKAFAASVYYGGFSIVLGSIITPEQLSLSAIMVTANILKIMVLFDCLGIFNRKLGSVRFFIKHRFLLWFIRIFIAVILELSVLLCFYFWDF